MTDRPIRVAILGGGCAAITTAFELSRPEHRGRYEVTIYQVGWRLGGKGASGRRPPSQRIEEHGLHVWLGYYENAFRLLRECYEELGRDPESCPLADCFQAFQPEHFISLADSTSTGWRLWSATFPATNERPGDPFATPHPFTLRSYVARSVQLLRTLLLSARDTSKVEPASSHVAEERGDSQEEVISRWLRLGRLATCAGLLEGLHLLERSIGSGSNEDVARLVDAIGSSLRTILRTTLADDVEMTRVWCLVDLVLAFLRGYTRFGLADDPRGFDALDDFECREWLKLNGASPETLDSTFVRSLYDLGFAYADGTQPKVAAGQALRGAMRMFFTYRGAVFWKMRAGMGDVVFAPYYQLLTRRGVRFKFFHRLEAVRLSSSNGIQPDQRPHVTSLELSVQAQLRQGLEVYQPLVDIDGLPCWPAEPLWDQLADGEMLRQTNCNFENHWERRSVKRSTLRVGRDFDAVVLGVGLGAIPHVCQDLLARDHRWQEMVDHVGTVATQAFQVWLDADLKDLGWRHGPVTLSGFVEPFDTWAVMDQLAWTECWPGQKPGTIAYFCNVLPTPEGIPPLGTVGYLAKARERVRANAVRFLSRDVAHLWPNAVADGNFRWDLLSTVPGTPGHEAIGEARFDTQFWTANVNPSDRYVLTLPGTSRYRISPLDNTYDNMTVAGDWTHCGHNHGCVEAAVMSGRLAAHAISGYPKLEDIVGYDHP